MPVLTVYGIKPQRSMFLRELRGKLMKTVSSVTELNLKEEHVSCFFPADLDTERGSGEVIVFVNGLYDKPERTEEVRNKLAARICGTIQRFLESETALVECFIMPFNPANGFYRTK